MALLDLFNPLLNGIKTLLGPFGRAFDLIRHLWQNLTDGFEKGKELAGLVRGEIDAWRHFREDINFRTGVVSLPAAVQATKDLVAGVVEAWHAAVDLFGKVKGKLTESAGPNPTEEAEQALKDIESSGFKSILKQFPKFAKGLEKALGFVAILVDTLDNLLDAIDDLLAIVNALKDLREEIETGKTIFLQQKNARKTLKLKDGGSIKIRVGNLHS